jgi:tetratricopeptide (TPR) repeat protein
MSSNYTEPALMRSNARQSLNRALQLDPNMAEAHVTAGSLKLRESWDFAGAEASIRQAVRLNPNLATAHADYSHLLRVAGRSKESIREAERAKQLDPLSRGNSVALATALYYDGQYDKAAAELNRLIVLAPTFSSAHYLLGRVYADQGRAEAACAAFLKSDELDETDPARLAVLRRACRESGLTGYFQESLQFLVADNPTGLNYVLGAGYASVGDKQKAYEFLEKAFEQRETGMLLLKADPLFKAMRAEPRFRALLTRIGFDRARPG